MPGTVVDPLALLREASFITADADRGVGVVLATRTRLEQPRASVASATLVATGHGIYEATVDGAPVGEDLFAPQWTSYEWRLQYQTYDVTDAVRAVPGEEIALAAHVGNGWYRGDLGFEGADANYGEEIGWLAALQLTYENGATQVIPTSPEWTATASDVVENSIYHGQRIDARLRGAGARLTVRAGEFDRDRLVAQVAEPVRRHEVLAPEKIWASPSGKTLVDFGQNLVGWIRLRASGPAGTEITLRHAEVLERGELGTRPLRSARATDTFVLSGDGTDAFEPTFTFHGFRYAEVTGWPGELRPEDLEAVVVHSAIRPTSSFECSEPLVNQLVHNSIWGQKGNFLSVPTDCPQRDERLGWTGDIAAYAATAAFQFDVADFLHNWLLDLAEEAKHDEHGYVPVIVPHLLKASLTASGRDGFGGRIGATAVWGDAAAWVPEALWHAYGDRERLAAQYPAMVAHVDSVVGLLSPTGLWDAGFQFADWLDPDAPPDEAAAAKADKGVVATASYYRSVAFTAQVARLLGYEDDAGRLDALGARVRATFREHYVADQRVRSDCATVYALAICFGLLDADETGWAADRLAALVIERDYRVTTGFAGTPFVTWALSEHGHVDVAYRLLLERECPSWLYPVTMGATTIWERWDSMLPDGSINPGEMTSFNHYALGAVADWIYQVVAGIRPAEPGYRRIRIQPVPGEGIDWVRATYDSHVGQISVAWSTAEGPFSLEVSIPDGVPAEIVLPDGTSHEVTGGHHTFAA